MKHTYAFVFALLITLTGVYGQPPAGKTFSLRLDGYRGAIQWESSIDNKQWSAVPNGTTSALTLTPSRTTYYRAKITEENCSPVYSDVKAAYVDGDLTVEAKLVAGKINLPTGTTTPLTDLTVYSMIGDSKVNNDGTFEILVKDSTAEEVIVVVNKKDEVVMLAYYAGTSRQYQMSSETTALALLTLYPFLKPVSVEQKIAMMNTYKAQVGFATLVTEVEQIVKQGSDLFSTANQALAGRLEALLRLEDNKNRLRVAAENPVEITSSGGTVTVKNNTAFSYTAGVYATGGTTPLGTPLNVAGSALSESIVMKQIIWSLRGPDEVNTQRAIDLKAMRLSPGEYEIRLRSGLAFDESVENKLAAKQNIYELLSGAIANMIPGPLDWLDDNECTRNIFDAFTSTLNPVNMANANRTGNVMKEYVLPIFKNYAEYVFNTNTYNCTRIKPNRLFVKLFNYANFAYGIYEKLNLSYVIDWADGPATINACQFLDNNYNTSPCFVLKSNAAVKTQYYACEAVELKVKAVQDELYYPNQATPVPGKQFVWVIAQGRGGFAPDGSVNSTATTDANGEAAIKWIMPSTAGDNLARAMFSSSNFVQFTTKTAVISPKVTTDGDGQTGAIGQPLKKSIVLTLLDGNNGDGLVTSDRYATKFVIKGGGILKPVAAPLGIGIAYEWTLGPQPGDQSVDVLLNSQPCIGQPEGMPIASVTFKATAIDPVITSVKITPDNPTLKKDETRTLTATAYNAGGKEVPTENSQWQWNSDNANIVSVAANGKQATVKGVAAGKANITATETGSGVKKPVVVTVAAEASKLVITEGNNQFRNTAGYLPKNLKVKLTDAANAPLSGVALKWEMVSGKGRLDYATSTTDANGLAENKFFVDYSNDKHDVKVTVVDKEAINSTFNETLRLVPMGVGNYWSWVGESFYKYAKYANILHKITMMEDGRMCDEITFNYTDSTSKPYNSIRCSERANPYFDKNQSEFSIVWGGFGVGLGDLKHYFKDGDTLDYRIVEGRGEVKYNVKTIKVISNTEILIQTCVVDGWVPINPKIGETIEYVFAGWTIYNQYITRGIGLTKTEWYTPKINWDDSYRLASPNVPSVSDCVLRDVLTLKDHKVVD